MGQSKMIRAKSNMDSKSRHNLFILILLFAFALYLSAAQDSDTDWRVVSFPDADNECTARAGRPEVCVTFSNCPSWNSRGRSPPCRWEGTTPYFCCASSDRASPPAPQPAPPSGGQIECGIRFPVGQEGSRPLIVGGQEAIPYSWPWMASMLKVTGPRTAPWCGGALINNRYILTAAHCFGSEQHPNATRYPIRLGAHSKNEGTVYQVERIIVHQRFNPSFHYNDIALMRLKEEVVFDGRVRPVCLPSSSMLQRNFVGRNATVTGWGDTAFGGVSSRVLMEVELPVVSNDNCNSAYTRNPFPSLPNGVDQGMICAGYEEGGKDACQRDSGGPLVTTDDSTRWTIIGVVSFGRNCAEAGYPGVYARVTHFMRWIEANME